MQRYRGKAINKHILLVLLPRSPHQISGLGWAMGGLDRHSPLVVSRDEKSMEAVEAQPNFAGVNTAGVACRQASLHIEITGPCVLHPCLPMY